MLLPINKRTADHETKKTVVMSNDGAAALQWAIVLLSRPSVWVAASAAESENVVRDKVVMGPGHNSQATGLTLTEALAMNISRPRIAFSSVLFPNGYGGSYATLADEPIDSFSSPAAAKTRRIHGYLRHSCPAPLL